MIYKQLLMLLHLIHKSYELHNLGTDNPETAKHRALDTLITKTIENINSLCEIFGQECHELRNKIGELSYDYLMNADKKNLGNVSKKIEYLQLMLTSLINACMTSSDPEDLNDLSFRVVGIEKNRLHKELDCHSLLSFFYRSDEEQLYYDISKAIDEFNEALRFKGELQDLNEDAPKVINHEPDGVKFA